MHTIAAKLNFRFSKRERHASTALPGSQATTTSFSRVIVVMRLTIVSLNSVEFLTVEKVAELIPIPIVRALQSRLGTILLSWLRICSV